MDIFPFGIASPTAISGHRYKSLPERPPGGSICRASAEAQRERHLSARPSKAVQSGSPEPSQGAVLYSDSSHAAQPHHKSIQ